MATREAPAADPKSQIENPKSPGPLLKVDNIDTFIGQFHILRAVSLEVPRGSVTALLGRNGAGKTTTLRSIMGLLTPSTGKVVLDGQEVQGLAPHTIAGLGVGYVPEHRAIFRDLTVEENLKIAERRKGDLKRSGDFIMDLFPDLGRFYKHPGGQLSGGQQQMLSIARALVADNHLLLVDEPSEGLAPVIIEHIVQALRKLQERVTVLLVEQNFRMAADLADRYYILDDGHAVHQGRMADLAGNLELVTRYLGAG